MILNELVLHNVGTFAGRQAIDLTPPSDSKEDIELFSKILAVAKSTLAA